jgi:hypothetical protein
VTRVRGMAPWEPRAKTLPLLENMNAVLETYAEQLPLTLRQIFYRLVAAYGYDKTENAYASLGETLNRARRGGQIPFEAIRDDGITAVWPREFLSPEDFWEMVNEQVEDFELSAQEGQPQVIEIWVEAAGMVPQAFDAANPKYGVPVFSSSGFDSTTAKYNAADRFLAHERPTVVIHVGDYDPSGIALFEAARDDVTAFYVDLGGEQPPQFVRAAVTPEQIERFHLPSAPPKKNDKRSAFTDTKTVQAEALPPDVLQTEIVSVVEQFIDQEVLAARRERSRLEHERLLNEIEAKRDE